MSEYRRNYDLTDEAEEREYMAWAENHGAYIDAAGDIIWPHEAHHPNNQPAPGDDGFPSELPR